jgi:hypothetical protein
MKSLAWIQNFSANAVVPVGVDVIRGTGGAGGITLTLTPASYVVQASGAVTITVYQSYQAMKVDAGVGPVTFVDPNGALFNGQSSWDLVDQYQWATFAWNGTGWEVFD